MSRRRTHDRSRFEVGTGRLLSTPDDLADEDVDPSPDLDPYAAADAWRTEPAPPRKAPDR